MLPLLLPLHKRDSPLTIVVECKSKRQSHRVTGAHNVHSIFIQLAACVLMVCIWRRFWFVFHLTSLDRHGMIVTPVISRSASECHTAGPRKPRCPYYSERQWKWTQLWLLGYPVSQSFFSMGFYVTQEFWQMIMANQTESPKGCTDPPWVKSQTLNVQVWYIYPHPLSKYTKISRM